MGKQGKEVGVVVLVITFFDDISAVVGFCTEERLEKERFLRERQLYLSVLIGGLI
jgi:hypothetical protein